MQFCTSIKIVTCLVLNQEGICQYQNKFPSFLLLFLPESKGKKVESEDNPQDRLHRMGIILVLVWIIGRRGRLQLSSTSFYISVSNSLPLPLVAAGGSQPYLNRTRQEHG